MPFKSEKQRKWMWANEPDMARKWENEEKKEKKDDDRRSEKQKRKDDKK